MANKISSGRYELQIEEMESVVGDRLLAELPEYKDAPISIANQIPAYVFYPRSPFARSVRALSKRYTTGKGLEPIVAPARRGFFAFLLRLFGIRKRLAYACCNHTF